MDKICIVIPYFGKTRNSFGLFLESCKRNPTIDWLFVVDFDINIRETPNIKVIKTNLQTFQKWAKERIYYNSVLDRPYKLCDYKPFYGMVFENELKEYDWWGYGDTDVIYGNIREIFENIDRNNYFKINWWGHLCLIRNIYEINRICIAEINGTMSYKRVLQTVDNCGFDETDYNNKFVALGKKIYTGLWSADIDIFYKRMRCVDKKTMNVLCGVRKQKWAPQNNINQIFVCLDGRIYRYYVSKGKIGREEYAYIHFRNECPVYFDDIKCTSFIISREGFYKVDDVNLFKEKKQLMYLIKKYNKQEGLVKEIFRFIYYCIKTKCGK